MSQLLVKRDEYTPTGWDIIYTHLTVQIYSNFARTTDAIKSVSDPVSGVVTIWSLFKLIGG